MPGRRRDKERAWDNLDGLLEGHRQIAATLAMQRGEAVMFMWHHDEELALNLLKKSGRLDRVQISLIRKLCQAVIRVERNPTVEG